ncbi:heme/hemin ABC transporter substrate-binding protein [Streptomyces sp. NPDC054796]
MTTGRWTSVRMPRLGAAAAAALALLLPLTGCAQGGTSPVAGEAKGKAAASAAPADRVEPLSGDPAPRLPATVEGDDGRRVTVRQAERIVPLTGSISEIVFTLGLGPRVVGRDITATFEQAAKLPVVTRGHEVSAESVLSLRPDVVLADSTTGPAQALDQIRSAGVPVVVLEAAKELTDVADRITRVATALGVPDAGKALTKRTDRRIAAAREKIPAHHEKPRVAFLYVRGSASVHLIGGRDSGAGSLLEAAGALDAGTESGLTKDFTPITSEALAKAAPDAFLVMTKGLESVGGVDGLLELPGVAQTPAGQRRRVVTVDDGVLLNYGPRTDQVLTSLVRQLYRDGDR